MRGVMFWVGLVIVVIMMNLGQVTQEYDLKENQLKNQTELYNLTQEAIEWNSTKFDEGIEKNLTNYYNNSLILNSKRAQNIIYKTFDWVGFTFMEIMKWGFEFGYNNPQYHFGWFARLMIWMFVLILVIPLVPIMLVAIFPMLALGYLICIGIHKTYNYILKRYRNG